MEAELDQAVCLMKVCLVFDVGCFTCDVCVCVWSVFYYVVTT